jgi:SAM-dependent methyltransferase
LIVDTQADKTAPDYSPYARHYAQSRPGYPTELFAYLASLVDRRQLAWDCATGNGQAAAELVKLFDRVIATDISAEQIRQAAPHPRIDYRVAGSERSGLDDRSVDLIAVASAMHWFDLDRFYAEVNRVARPGAILAAWTYHVAHVDPPFDRVLGRFYTEIVFPYFGAGARLVDDRYATITLPGAPIPGRDFHVQASWNLDQMLAFIRSWSGTQEYLRQRGTDPVALIARELESVWGDRTRMHTVRWPLYLRISKLERGEIKGRIRSAKAD